MSDFSCCKENFLWLKNFFLSNLSKIRLKLICIVFRTFKMHSAGHHGFISAPHWCMMSPRCISTGITRVCVFPQASAQLSPKIQFEAINIANDNMESSHRAQRLIFLFPQTTVKDKGGSRKESQLFMYSNSMLGRWMARVRRGWHRTYRLAWPCRSY